MTRKNSYYKQLDYHGTNVVPKLQAQPFGKSRSRAVEFRNETMQVLVGRGSLPGMAALPEFITLELHNSLCRKIAELTRVIDRLFRQYYEQSLQLEDLKQQVQPHKAARLHLEKEIKILQHTLEKLQDELKSKEEHEKRCIADHQPLEQQAQSLLRRNRELEEENHRLLQDLSQVRSNLEDMEIKLQHHNESYEFCSDQLARIAVLEDQIKDEVTQNSLLAKKNAMLSKELENLKILKKQNDSESEGERYRMQLLVRQLQDRLKLLQAQPSPVVIATKKQFKPKPVPVHRVKREKEYWLESLPKVRDVVHVATIDFVFSD